MVMQQQGRATNPRQRVMKSLLTRQHRSRPQMTWRSLSLWASSVTGSHQPLRNPQKKRKSAAAHTGVSDTCCDPTILFWGICVIFSHQGG
jgi:hypothetical protein